MHICGQPKPARNVQTVPFHIWIGRVDGLRLEAAMRFSIPMALEAGSPLVIGAGGW
jgi:hypothetical protein